MNTLSKYTIIVYTAIVILCLCFSGCNRDESDLHTDNKWSMHQFQISGIKTDMQAPPLPSLQAYLFADGKLKKIYEDLETDANGTIEFPAKIKGTVYLVAGAPQDTGLGGLVEGESTIDDFLSITTAALADSEEPVLFYSGKTEIGASSSNEVILQRSIARLDLDIPEGADIKVTKIVLDNMPLQATLFGEYSNSTALQTGTRTLEFPNGGISSSKENICRMYETDGNKAVTATIYSTYGSTPRIVRVTLPQVKRNFKYTLKPAYIGSIVNGMFEVTPWTEGNTTNTTEDTRINFYALGCEFPPTGGSISDDNAISLPAGGGELTLAFSSPFVVKLTINRGNGDEVISSDKTDTNPDGTVISSFRINVPASAGGQAAYRIELNLEDIQSSSYRRFWIDVASSSHS